MSEKELSWYYDAFCARTTKQYNDMVDEFINNYTHIKLTNNEADEIKDYILGKRNY